MRKKLFLLSLLAAGIFWGFLFYFCWAAGFVAAKWGGGTRDGRRGRVRSIIVRWRRYELHLHHWFLSAVAGGMSTVTGFVLVAPEVFYGVLSGLVFQGIYCYSDWHRIVKRKSALLILEPQGSLFTGNARKPSGREYDSGP